MSSNSNKSDQAKNQAGQGANKPAITQDGEGGLTIPTLGQAGANQQSAAAAAMANATAASQITQDGEGNDTAAIKASKPDLGGAAAAANSLGIDVAPAEPPSTPAPGSLAALTAAVDASPQRARVARDEPVSFRRMNEATETSNGVQVIEVPIYGDLANLKRPDLRIDQGRVQLFSSREEHIAFLNEHVIVHIHETADPLAEPWVELGVNGRKVFLKRGEDQIVRRMFVSQLLRAKPQRVTTQVAKGQDGDYVNKTIKSSAMKYPFSMVRDDNPKGAPWMRQILSEG
jgi:hypothetical protein